MRFPLLLSIFLLFIQPQLASSKALSATDKVVNKFMALDLNASGSVSYKEYRTMVMQRLARRFRIMDANKDGNVTKKEYRNFWTKTKSRYYRPRRE